MEYGLRAGVLQFRLRGGGGRCSLRHVLGRRHVRVHSSSIVVVRGGGTAAHVEQGEPVWVDADNLVDGPGGADVAHTAEIIRGVGQQRTAGSDTQVRSTLSRHLNNSFSNFRNALDALTETKIGKKNTNKKANRKTISSI